MAEFEARRAKPGDRFTVTGANGEQHEFKADASGLVRAKSVEEAGLLATFDLPVAHTSARPKRKSSKKPAAKAPAAVVPASPPIDEANPTIEETF